jgi:hypothetical protein
LTFALFTLENPSGPRARSDTTSVLALPHDPYDLLPSVTPLGRTVAESHLLARAVSCPDRYLISLPVAEQSRILGILADALRPESRCLILTPNTSEANSIVEQIPESIRLVAESEASEPLPTAVRSRTFHRVLEQRQQALREECEARIEKLAAEQTHLAGLLSLWDELQAQEERWTALEVQKTDVIVEAEPLHETAELEATEDPGRAQLMAKLPALRKELEQLTPVVSAKRSGKIFSAAFWKATFQPALCERASVLEEEIGRAEQLLAGSGDHTPLPEKPTQQRDQLLSKIAKEQAALLDEFQRLRTDIQNRNAVPPTELNAEQISATRKAVATRSRDVESEVNRLRQLLLAEPDLPLTNFRVFVGTRGVIADATFPSLVFDQVIVTSAEGLTTAEWVTLSQVGERQMFFGEFQPAQNEHSANGKTLPNDAQPVEHPVLAAWKDQSRLGWFREGRTLTVRLVTVEGQLTSEPLADRPDVELRFGTTTEGEYVLAEVAFPDSINALEARELLVELSEAELNPLGPTEWHALRVCFPWVATREPAIWIERQKGIRERVADCDGLPVTTEVVFDAHDWMVSTAEQWLVENTRTVRARRLGVIRPA